MRSESRMKARDGPLIEAMTSLANLYPRYGYRRIQVFMEHLGHVMGPDKTFRLWSKTAFKCRRSAPGNVLRGHVPGHNCRAEPTRYGRTISCLMPAPTGNS